MNPCRTLASGLESVGERLSGVRSADQVLQIEAVDARDDEHVCRVNAPLRWPMTMTGQQAAQAVEGKKGRDQKPRKREESRWASPPTAATAARQDAAARVPRPARTSGPPGRRSGPAEPSRGGLPSAGRAGDGPIVHHQPAQMAPPRSVINHRIGQPANCRPTLSGGRQSIPAETAASRQRCA